VQPGNLTFDGDSDGDGAFVVFTDPSDDPSIKIIFFKYLSVHIY